MNIIIMGPQGSGKGTQAQIIKKEFNIPHVSTGEIFRQNIHDKTELGQKIEALINSGGLVSDETTNEIIKDRLSQPDCDNGFILDGYPRNPDQAKYLDTVKEIELALEIFITDETALKRISNRRSCKNCGHVYHLITNPPAKPDTCGQCGSNLIMRDDDKEEAIRKRLKTYHEHSDPLIQHYKNKGVYYKIDGMPAINEVAHEVINLLNKVKKEGF